MFKEIVLKYIGGYLTKKVLETSFIGIRNAVKRINKDHEIINFKHVKIEDCIEFIQDSIEENLKWANNISFQGAKSKSLLDVFIDINLFVHPKRELINERSIPDSINFNELLVQTDQNIVLLGDPGAGKTTTIKKIFLEVINKKHEIYETFNVPIIIKLKDLNVSQEQSELILFKEILSVFGMHFTLTDKYTDVDYIKILKHIFREFIERLNVLIILDGYDEIPNESVRLRVVENLKIISNSIVNSRFILTSRIADYNIHIENTEVYEISPLNEEQVTEFISKWLKNDRKSLDLYTKLKDSPYWDTAMRPLLLAHMCALYEKHGDIPNRPKSVYDKIVSLLLEEWNTQNLVNRVSRYGNFGVERKMEFLSTFAYHLTIHYEKFWFTKEILKDVYNAICLDFDLPKNQSTKVINEIESHNGLIVQSGMDKFEFSHKSLEEYLVACYLIKMPKLISDKAILCRIPNEIAISIAISSGPSFTYYYYIYETLKEEILNRVFLKVFLKRMILEKPDFENLNPLLVITNVYILNLIAKKLYIYYEPVKKVIEESTEYFSNCTEMVLYLSRKNHFKQSMKKLKLYYNIEEIEDSSRLEYDFKGWGDIVLLKKIGSFSYYGNEADLPESLYMPKNLL